MSEKEEEEADSSLNSESKVECDLRRASIDSELTVTVNSSLDAVSLQEQSSTPSATVRTDIIRLTADSLEEAEVSVAGTVNSVSSSEPVVIVSSTSSLPMDNFGISDNENIPTTEEHSLVSRTAEKPSTSDCNGNVNSTVGTCIVCRDKPDNVISDSCLHQFCFDCISKWRVLNNICPICKRQFTTFSGKSPDCNILNSDVRFLPGARRRSTLFNYVYHSENQNADTDDLFN